MNQEKVSKFIKNLRTKNNLTQKDLALKYGVTYQAVSKWENGKNLPDMLLLKQMSKDFNVSLDDIFEGEYSKKNKNKKILLIIISIFILFLISFLIILIITKDTDFKFKTLSSDCDNFDISGSISYNTNKSAIHIGNINYCGEDNLEKYKSIECSLYESNDNIEKKISTCDSKDNKLITLDDFLEDVSFTVDNYSSTCKEYSNNNLYLVINATDKNDKVTTYKINLTMDATCN